MARWRFQGGGKLYNLTQWQAAGEDLGSTATIGPMFVCPRANPCSGSSRFDFHLQNCSPAQKVIAIQAFDYSQAGRMNPVVTPPLPPAMPLKLPSGY